MKTAKKIIAVLLCFVMLSATQAVNAFAVTEYTYDNFTYTVNSKGAVITFYPETAKGAVEIPSQINGNRVIAIDDYAFASCTLITEVEIPRTVQSIGNYAFAYCTSLSKVTIPSSVTSIGNNAFQSSKKVTIYCPAGSIADDYAFNKSIPVEYIPADVESVIGNFEDYVITVILDGEDSYISELTIDGVDYPVKANALPFKSSTEYDKYQSKEVYVRFTDGLATDLLLTNQDTDNDGLFDFWEKYGADFDKDCKVDLAINEMGAEPNVPDIFVEVDWMVRPAKKFLFWETKQSHSFKPSENVLRMVYNSFDSHGINIHLDAGRDSVDFVTGKRWGDLSGGNEVKYTETLKVDKNYEVWNDLLDMSDMRTLVFHHCLFADLLYSDTSNTTSGITPGFGQYFAVTLGGWGTVNDMTIAGTFMHELGHSLGLYHGGCDHEHYKPNYLSIMNYAFQTTGLAGNGALNYSDYKLPNIDESKVNEVNGIDPAGMTEGTNIATTVFYWTANQMTTGAISRTSIDFNNNGTLERNISIDLNPGGNVEDSAISVLKGHNDWNGINYHSGSIGSSGILGHIPAASISAGATLDEEKTLEESIETATLAVDGTGCVELVSPMIIKDVDGQYLYLDVVNLGANDATFTIKIQSSLLFSNYSDMVTVKGSKTQIEKTRIAIPVNASNDEGVYSIECSLYAVGKDAVTEELSVSVYEPSKEELVKMKELLEEDVTYDIDSDILEQMELVVSGSEQITLSSIENISLTYKSSTTITPTVEVDGDVDYTVTYESSDTSVVAVDENGRVTTNGTGSAEITVTVTDEYGNTVTDTCEVNVSYAWWQWIIVIVLFGWIWY